jgi:hypothetical protein
MWKDGTGMREIDVSDAMTTDRENGKGRTPNKLG